MSKKLHSDFEKYLKNNDSRYTEQKRAITDCIIKEKGHFEIEDFIDRLRSGKQRLSRATVYRTVKQLLDAKLLQKISTRDGKVFYEITAKRKHHAHLICNECGSIEEIKDTSIDAMIDTHCESMGFTPEYRSLHIYGKCKRCQKELS